LEEKGLGLRTRPLSKLHDLNGMVLDKPILIDSQKSMGNNAFSFHENQI
jgi:hypothetical protein